MTEKAAELRKVAMEKIGKKYFENVYFFDGRSGTTGLWDFFAKELQEKQFCEDLAALPHIDEKKGLRAREARWEGVGHRACDATSCQAALVGFDGLGNITDAAASFALMWLAVTAKLGRFSAGGVRKRELVRHKGARVKLEASSHQNKAVVRRAVLWMPVATM